MNKDKCIYDKEEFFKLPVIETRNMASVYFEDQQKGNPMKEADVTDV